MPERLESRLFERLAGDGREPEERRRLARLMRILAELPAPPDPLGLVPRYAELRDSFLEHLVKATERSSRSRSSSSTPTCTATRRPIPAASGHV